MRLVDNKRTAPTNAAAPPTIKANLGSLATDGSPATGNDAVGVGLGVASGAGAVGKGSTQPRPGT